MPSYDCSLHKMKTRLRDEAEYSLQTEQGVLDLNAHIGEAMEIRFTGEILCVGCGRKTTKSFSQGFCYPCFKSKASCDMCIMKPETCHYDQGTCREPEWADKHCMQGHYVYLSNSSGLKVGITRQDQLPTRWIDQGAIQAIPMLKVSQRFQSGLIEHAIAEQVNDKTNWRAMLKGEVVSIDLAAERDRILTEFESIIVQESERFGENSFEILEDPALEIEYPVLNYPEKIKTYNFDKDPVVNDCLIGIKGQYLIFEQAVLNVRKFGGYQVEINT